MLRMREFVLFTLAHTTYQPPKQPRLRSRVTVSDSVDCNSHVFLARTTHARTKKPHANRCILAFSGVTAPQMTHDLCGVVRKTGEQASARACHCGALCRVVARR